MIPGQVPLTRRRYEPGAIGADGRWQKPAPAETPLMGCPQPLSGREAKDLPEGERASDYRVVYTETELRPVDEHVRTDADEVLIDGQWYRVQQVQHWSTVMPHYRATVRRLQGGP